MEMELEAMKVKGEHRIGFGDGYVIMCGREGGGRRKGEEEGGGGRGGGGRGEGEGGTEMLAEITWTHPPHMSPTLG